MCNGARYHTAFGGYQSLSIREDLGTPCVINDSSSRRSRSPKTAGEPETCQVVDSVRRLATLGLSAREIEDLGLAEPALKVICEYARLDEGDGSRPASDAVDATLRTLAEETRKADLELEMLGLRKRALTNRAKLLQKLARILDQQGPDPMAS
jgi:hypothetical protein